MLCHLFNASSIPEPDRFNNICLIWECAIVFAAATGRTLVLPPDWKIPFQNLGENYTYYSFDDLYPLDDLVKVMNVISTEEFLGWEVRRVG